MTPRDIGVNRLVLASLVASLCFGIGQAEAEFCTAEPVATLATSEGPDGSTLIPMSLNGMKLAATLDTGAPVSVVREGIAEQLGLHRMPIPLDAMSGVGGRPFEEGAMIDQVSLGGATVQAIPFLIAPRTHAADAQSAGLIGANVFARFDLFLDFGGKRIALYRPGSCVPTDLSPVAVTIQPSRHVYMRLEVDGKRVDTLLDTGASRSVMTLDTAHRLFGLDPNGPGMRRIGSMIGADGGQIAAYGYAFKQLTLGDIELAAPSVVLVPDETRRLHRVITPGQSEGEGLPDLVLGMPELRRLQLLVAYDKQQLFVRETPAP